MPDPSAQVISRSLEEVHRTVRIPDSRWWRRLFAFVGPAYMVSVGYMDPGNWATDLEGGSRFGYALIWVLLMSNLMAVLLQTLSARLGIVTGHDLAQACRDDYPRGVRYVLFGLCEIAIAACDLAEIIGSAIGLNLLLNIPVLYGVLITAADVLLLLAMQRLGIRKIEAFIVTLIFIVGLCFVAEIFLSKPSVSGIAGGFIPQPLSGSALYIAVGILGATVMPHNLYLHSALVQSRDVARSRNDVKAACRFNLIDSVIALNGAFFVNAAILIVAAATFWNRVEVERLQQAPELLQQLLGSDLARNAFAVALLCAGQSSTLTGTLAGQITMEGFLNFRMRAWLRRVMTRSLAIIPAVIAIWLAGDAGLYQLLILSQVVLSVQLSFAVVPLVRFTNSRQKMGPFANPRWVMLLAWLVALIIMALNGRLAYETISNWMSKAGRYSYLVAAVVIPAAAGLAGLLLYMVFRRERVFFPRPIVDASDVAEAASGLQKRFRRIGVALEAKPSDSTMLGEAIALAKVHGAELILMHVVEGVGGQWYGPQTGDQESRQDEIYIHQLAERLRQDLSGANITVRPVLGYGNVPQQLVHLAKENELDLLVSGGHGHRGLSDIIRGQTINTVRHQLKIPVMSVR